METDTQFIDDWNMPVKTNKFEYYCVLQGNYGHGWEDLTAGTRREMRANLKEYRENEGGTYRIINRREPKQ